MCMQNLNKIDLKLFKLESRNKALTEGDKGWALKQENITPHHYRVAWCKKEGA